MSAPMTMRTARAAGGLTRHIPSSPPTAQKRGRKVRRAPDPMKISDGDEAASRLQGLIERAERVIEEIKFLQDDLSDIFSEAKDQGYDTKSMKRVIAIRKQDRSDFLEAEGILETYLNALGML